MNQDSGRKRMQKILSMSSNYQGPDEQLLVSSKNMSCQAKAVLELETFVNT
jgi:hypothetical protein